MKLIKWEELPESLKNDKVKEYYDILNKKKISLFFKRLFDIGVSFIMLVILSPLFVILAILIKLDSKGPVFYRQERVTQYGRVFRIHKFRSMVDNADKKGTLVTVSNDNRITKVGKFIRKYKFDELAQLIDVFIGDMTFVGVRPEAIKYVDSYTDEMKATLLLPAGITNLTSIYFVNENEMLDVANDPDKVYISQILPIKMKYNLKGLSEFSFFNDIKLMFMTFFAILGKEYKEE